LPANWTPTKVRPLAWEEVPEVFVSVARHLARPRLHVDHAVSLPAIDMPLCDGARYGALAALAANTPLRNGVEAGQPDALINAIVIAGAGMAYRHRVYLALRRNFDGLKMISLKQREGLTPARFTWWNSTSNSYSTFLDAKDPFENAVLDADMLLQPIILPAPAPPAMPAGVRPGPGPLQLAWDLAAGAHLAGAIIPELQIFGGNLLTGALVQYPYSAFVALEQSGRQLHPQRTVTYTLGEVISRVREDLKEFDFPALGVVKEIDDLRVLVNDLGSGPRDLNRRDTRARERSVSRVDSKAVRELTGQDSEAKSDGSSTSERHPTSALRSDSDSLSSERKVKSYKQRRGKKKAAPVKGVKS